MSANSWDFLFNAVVEAPNATIRRLVPEGEYHASIGEVKFDNVTFKTGERKGQNAPKLIITWNLMDEKLEAEWERKDIKFTDNFIVDLDKFNKIDTGPDKNVLLGQIREALGQNEGQWTPGMLKDTRPVLIVIKHRKDKDDDEKTYASVTRVAAIS
jgi:hypothetical protein